MGCEPIMDEESTQDERSKIAEEPAPGVDETLEEKRLSNENEPASKENVDLSYQSVSPVEAQNAIGKASNPKTSTNCGPHRIVCCLLISWYRIGSGRDVIIPVVNWWHEISHNERLSYARRIR